MWRNATSPGSLFALSLLLFRRILRKVPDLFEDMIDIAVLKIYGFIIAQAQGTGVKILGNRLGL